jgi:hypothetical protein
MNYIGKKQFIIHTFVIMITAQREYVSVFPAVASVH